MSSTVVDHQLVGRAPQLASAPRLDEAQRRVVAHADGPLLVLAGPGTGKTTTLVETVVDRVNAGLPAESALVLTFSRQAASELRHRISARLGRATVEPLARTFHSYAFGVLHRAAVAVGDVPPRLLSGAEQDRIVRDLLAGDVAANARAWPAELRPALLTRGFAQELRDLLLRCAERGLDHEVLRRLATSARRADWRAVARFARQYSEVKALAFPGAFDPAELVRAVLNLWAAEPELLERERSAFPVLLVDELQDADPSQLDLLEQIAGGGRFLIGVGDPDQSIYAFRGADPDGIRTFPERFASVDGRPAPVVCLTASRRSGPALLAATRRVAERLGGLGPHRALTASEGASEGAAEVHVLRSASQEAAYIAARLREFHLREGVPWERMAVLVRGAQPMLPALRRAFAAADVPPAAAEGGAVAVSEHPVVSALLLLLRCADTPQQLTEDAAEALLLSPYGGADALTLRRLRLELQKVSRAGAGTRSGDAAHVTDIDSAVTGSSAGINPSGERTAPPAPDTHTSPLAYALCCSNDLSLVDPRARRPLERLTKLLESARRAAQTGGGVEEVLWAVWSMSGLASRWSAQSALPGRRGEIAHADLDAVMGLFSAAAQFTDRLPQAGLGVFLDEMAGRVVPEASGTHKQRASSGVALLTAHAAKGLEWDVVVVAGVQEGSWPDLRQRGSILGREQLLRFGSTSPGASDVAGALAADRSRVLDEERRLFYVAATRARRQLVITAVLSERDELVPSRFLDDLEPLSGDLPRRFTDVPRALELSAVVSALRSELNSELLSNGALSNEVLSNEVMSVGALDAGGLSAELPSIPRPAGDGTSGPEAQAIALLLARLAAEGVPGAHPDEWYGDRGLSDAGPLRAPHEQVPVSPSRVESYLRCELRWFLEEAGGTDGDTSSTGVGTAVHAVAAAAEELLRSGADESVLIDRLDEVLAEVDLGRGWVARRGRVQAEDMVRRLARWIATNPRSFVGAEVPFQLELGRARLTGRIDRLDHDEAGRPVVVDFKTGSSSTPKAELAGHPQLGIYQLAASRGQLGADPVSGPSGDAVPESEELAGPAPNSIRTDSELVDSGGAELVQLGGGAGANGAKVQPQPPLLDAEDPLWPERMVVTAAEGMAGGVFHAMSNKLCTVCPVQSSCPARPEGRMVGA